MNLENSSLPPKQKRVWFVLFQVPILKPTFDEVTASGVGAMILWVISLGIFFLLGSRVDVHLAALLLLWCFWSTVSMHMGLILKASDFQWRTWLAYAFIGIHGFFLFELCWFFLIDRPA